MRVWDVYEYIYPAVGKPFMEFVGEVEARTEKSALNKAAKLFKVDRGGVSARRRHSENFKVF